jgi:hypothetical protein
MTRALDVAIRKQVPTIPEAIKALGAMEQQLTDAKTYEQLRVVMKQAEALKVLLGHVLRSKRERRMLSSQRASASARKLRKYRKPEAAANLVRMELPARVIPLQGVRRSAYPAHAVLASPSSPTTERRLLSKPPTRYATKARTRPRAPSPRF